MTKPNKKSPASTYNIVKYQDVRKKRKENPTNVQRLKHKMPKIRMALASQEHYEKVEGNGAMPSKF